MFTIETLQLYAGITSNLTIIFGVPIGIYKYWQSKRKEQRDREYGTYNALDEKYLEFEQLCLRSPELDIFDIPDEHPAPLNPIQKKQELIAFTMLFAIFERAFLMYHGQSDKLRRRQWSGWEAFVGEYCGRTNFQSAWEICGHDFDDEFQAYMARRIAPRRAAALSAPPS